MKMDELINKLIYISSLSELEDINSIDKNALLYAIAKSQRYDLLKNSDIRLNISDSATLTGLTKFLFSDEDILYEMYSVGFSFSKEELDSIFNIVLSTQQNSSKLKFFFRSFFRNKEELNTFIKEHEQFFSNYIHEEQKDVANLLKDCDSFVELILKGNNVELIGNLENYSSSNLKLLVEILKQNKKIPYSLGNNSFAQHLFESKSDLELNEFYELLNLFKEKGLYDKKVRNSELTSFSALIYENIDYLIEMASQNKSIPKCLIESNVFRDECIKKNRIDLAVQCLLPQNITNNILLSRAYCNELNIDPEDFYERINWITSYQEKNENIFNTFLATSLKDNVFNLNKEHYERFINDVEVQMSIAKLNDKELQIFSKILNVYNYRDYDITSMIVNIINNIHDYPELINSLDIENVLEDDLRKIVSVLQFSNNEYHINDLNSLRNYNELKNQMFANNYKTNDLTTNKENLLKLLFNIDLKEAQYIDTKYCHDNDNNNTLYNLKNSELPPQIYNYLLLINRIVECNDLNDLLSLYNTLNDSKVYENEIPFESYLRGKYTELYSKSLYRIDEKNQVYGPVDNISNEINYNGKNIKVCIPRTNFNFFVHCVGSCSLASDVIDTNYRNDWLDRPQLQDHFVACSYINEKGIYSIRPWGSVIFGFDSLESGSILGMGNTDIDSIGRYAKAYDGSRELQEGNGSRARFFVPSEILKTVNDGGYNEIVVERRNVDHSKNEEFKRKPDYIIMMAESMEQDNFNYLESLYQNQLSFVSENDKEEIKLIGDSKKVKSFLEKYNEIISQIAYTEGIPLNDVTNMYVDLIMKAKYFEDCLKASNEFDIPLVIIDKTYYLNKLLVEKDIYDDATIFDILEFYSKVDENKKKEIFNMCAKGLDVTQIMEPIESKNIRMGI